MTSEWAGTEWAGTPAPLATRALDSFTDHPGLSEQLLAVQGLRAQPWMPLGIRGALAIPAVWRAVTLIANTVGSLQVGAWRDGVRMAEPPRIVTRPNPFQTPRDFYRDTAWALATRGEALWYIGARDIDGKAITLLPIPAAEVVVEWADRRIGLRNYRWQGAEVARERVVHITFAQEAGSPRGVGPLQMCGAALSAAAEADIWAANFFAGGGVPSVVLRPQYQIDEAEAKLIKEAWVATPSNTPKVAAMIDVDVLTVDPERAQLTQARLQNAGEVARMYGIPGKLLEYAAPGSSLTYQNLAEVGTDFERWCLAPGYLEPIEQAVSDLLPRSTVARFLTEGLYRADLAARYSMAAAGLDAGIHDRAEARRMVDLEANAEVMPVPPNLAPVNVPAEVMP